MKIGIFGGAFQPPHLGHERALAAFLEETDVALCYVIPTGIPPHKRGETGVAPVHRLEMARLAFEPLSERVRVLDRELFSSEVSYTYLTLEHLMHLHPDGEFYLFVGSDQLLSFHTWKNAAFLLSHVTLCAMSRDGEGEPMEGKKRELEKEFGARLLLLKKKAYIISSSEVRTELSREGLSLSLSPKVSEYVIRHGLYGSREQRGRGQVLSLLEGTLSPSRYSHTLSVERECARLCDLLFYERKEALCLAALLHDRTKEWPLVRQLSFLEERSLLTEADRASPAVLHGISAARLSLEEGLLEESEASAIRYHTTGRYGMTLGEKILYFADYVEETRPHDACLKMRHAFYHALPEGKEKRREYLDACLLRVMEDTRDHLQKRNQEIHPLTLEGIRSLKERIKHDSH